MAIMVKNQPLQPIKVKVMQLFPELVSYLEDLKSNFPDIPAARKNILKKLTDYIRPRTSAGKPVQLTFICTHNSRRSHMGQVWAQAIAAYLDIPNVNCFSGGTETTAFNLRAIQALQRAGFQTETITEGENPFVDVRFSDDGEPVTAFSKKYYDPLNPEHDFAAIMTCSEADAECPFIPGAYRVSLTYEDPKVADGTPQETQRYDERCRQIAAEMLFVFSEVKARQ